MLEPGAIVEYEGLRWQVSSRNRQYRTCLLLRHDRQRLEVSDNADERICSGLQSLIAVVARPWLEWPFVALPARPKSGPVVRVSRTRGIVTTELEPLVDWTPANFLRPGGSIFFNPRLGLKKGEVLVATHQDGSGSRVPITPAFGTVARHIAKATPPKKPVTVFDRIVGRGILDDDR